MNRLSLAIAGLVIAGVAATRPANAAELPPSSPTTARAKSKSQIIPIPYTPDGPWNHQIHYGYTKDGLQWRIIGGPLMKQASVPDIIELSGKGRAGTSGTLFIYAVDARKDKPPATEQISRLVSTGRGKLWGAPEPIVFNERPGRGQAVDPSVVQLDDGRLRLYFYSMYPQPPRSQKPVEHRFYSAVSEDGLNFTLEKGVRFAALDVTDPEVVRVGDEWLMFISRGFETLLARSTDGLNFAEDKNFLLRGGGVPGALVLKDGKVRVYQCSPEGIVSVVFDPRTGDVTPDKGLRTPATADPALWPLSSGGYVIICKRWMIPQRRPKPAPPKKAGGGK